MDKLISMIETLLPDALSKWILGLSIPISGFLLTWPSYDLPAKYLSDTEVIKLILRLSSAGIPLLIGFGSLSVLLAYHNKKITAQNAELKGTINAVSTDAQGFSKTNKTLQSQLATNAQELDVLKKAHAELERIANERKFLLEVAVKKIAELSKPIEAASASSEPAPDDYHAPRRRLPPAAW